MRTLDLSKFEKVKEDKQTTTMRHADGHEMTILHAKLPKIQREQLKRLKMADGGDVQAPDSSSDQSSSQSADPSQDAPDKSITINVGTPQTQPAQSQPVQPSAPVAISPANPAVSMQDSPPAVQVPDVPKTPPNLNPNGTMNPNAVSQNTQAAANLQGQIDAAKNKAQQGVEQNYNSQAAQAAQIDQNNLADMRGHVDKFAQYVQQNPIDPNHWAQSQTTAQKVANAFGLLAGGFSGGFSGTGNNPALNFINQQIDRDISAQKSRMDQQHTIYGAYQQLYGDSVAANAATKASMLDIYKHQFNQIANQLGTPQAAQAALAFGAKAAVEQNKLLLEGSGNITNLQGYRPVGTNAVAPGQMPGKVGGQNPPANNAISQSGPNRNGKDFNEAEGIRTYPVLTPGAVDQASGLRHVGYLDQGKLQKQLTSADQIDKVLNGPQGDGRGGIHDLLLDMFQDLGGDQAHPISPVDPSAIGTQLGMGAAKIPVIGEALEGGMNLLGSQNYNDFMRKRSGIITDLSTGLAGLVAPTDIVKIVDENLPRGGDSRANLETSEQQIVNTIKKALQTDELQKAGLLSPGFRGHKRK